MEKIFEIARKFKLAIFIIAVVAVSSVSVVDAFWSPDLIPHPPVLPVPIKIPEIS